MTLEQLKAFLAKAKDDQSIQDKLKAVKSPEDVVTIAKEHGHEFTADKVT
ncbi:Nif11-like leader peptide family natural product precursor [Synechococcus sp. UW179A]